MQLVSFLVSGVNGAANGTATFVLRGTSSSAASSLFNDFEGTSQPGTNVITLDANGAAEVYCNAYCDVTLKDSGGSTLRTVTVGNAATTTEVISDSFTGTDYSGSPTQASEPITLAAILDKWNNSSGALDWKVLVGGVSTNLSSAFAGFAGMFFNVKDPQYGAVGDGTTDDTTAIGLAISAASTAGGGIVFFPPTTSFYKITTLTVSAANITLMGSGPKASLLKSASTSGAILAFTDTTVGAWKRMFGLGLQGTGANSNALMTLDASQNVYIDNCDFNCSTYLGPAITRSATSGSAISFIVMNNCQLTLGASNTYGLRNLAALNQTKWKVTNCNITMPASFAGTAVGGSDFDIRSTSFDAYAVTTGSPVMFDPHVSGSSTVIGGSATGCIFYNGGFTGGSAFALTSNSASSNFSESNNIFFGYSGPATIDLTGPVYGVTYTFASGNSISLQSRLGRSLTFTQTTGSTVALGAMAHCERIRINHTDTATHPDLTITPTASKLPDGHTFIVEVANATLTTRTYTLAGDINTALSSVTSGGIALFFCRIYEGSVAVMSSYKTA